MKTPIILASTVLFTALAAPAMAQSSYYGASHYGSSGYEDRYGRYDHDHRGPDCPDPYHGGYRSETRYSYSGSSQGYSYPHTYGYPSTSYSYGHSSYPPHGYGGGYSSGYSGGYAYARPSQGYGQSRRWRRGAVIPQGHRSDWFIRDYGRHGYHAPPRGCDCGYYRTDTGEVVLALLASGVIVSLLDD